MRILVVLALVGFLSAVPVGTEAPEGEPPGTEESEKALEEFIPSEKVSAEGAVAFPVDI